ncbi:MAG: flavodoxin [Bacteroides sp.]|nr:flavodoxin [Bacteroides sp.]
MNNQKVLVAFFSRTGENYNVGHITKGNTHIIAEMIADETGGTLFQIEPVTPYPDNYNECIEIAKTEKNNHARPAIKGDIAVEDYDIIYLGYPNWWGDMPMPVYTFIEKHKWAGKTVIPFCTHEGSGLSGTESKLKTACQGATVARGLAIQGKIAQQSRTQALKTVQAWLKK